MPRPPAGLRALPLGFPAHRALPTHSARSSRAPPSSPAQHPAQQQVEGRGKAPGEPPSKGTSHGLPDPGVRRGRSRANKPARHTWRRRCRLPPPRTSPPIARPPCYPAAGLGRLTLHRWPANLRPPGREAAHIVTSGARSMDSGLRVPGSFTQSIWVFTASFAYESLAVPQPFPSLKSLLPHPHLKLSALGTFQQPSLLIL